MSALQHRLKRLERSLPPPVSECPGCGYPRTRKLMLYVVTRNDDPLPTCPYCGKPVAPDGTPIDGPCKRLILAEGEEGI